MGVTGQDHVDPVDIARQFLVHVKPVVRQDDNTVGPFGAHLGDHLFHAFFADAKAQVGEHPTRVGNRHIGESLPDDGDLYAATFEHFIRLIRRFIPFGVKDICAQEREVQFVVDDVGDTINAKRKFPMRRHSISAQGIEKTDHIRTIGPQSREGALPSVTAIKDKCVRTIGLDRLDDCGNTIETAHLAIGLPQGNKVVIGQRIVQRGSGVDIVHLAEIRAGHMWRFAFYRSDTQIDFRFAEPDRLGLGVNIGDVDQSDVAGGFHVQQVILRQALLSCEPRPVPKTAGAVNGGCGKAGLNKVTARDHVSLQSNSKYRICCERKGPSPEKTMGQLISYGPKGLRRSDHCRAMRHRVQER